MAQNEFGRVEAAPNPPPTEGAPATHTPGPWVWYSEDASMATLCRKSDSVFGVDLESHVLSVTICKSCHQGHAHWEWGRCYTANAADARLIAASPDMLELLLDVREYLNDHADVDQPSGERPMGNAAMRLLVEVDAVIARARND